MTRWRASIVLAALLVAVRVPTTFAESSKLDIAARIAIHNLRHGTPAAAMRANGIMAATDQGEIDCFIAGDVTREELEAAGARIRTALPGIFTAFVPLASIDAVAAIAGVQRIEGAQGGEAETNVSVPTTHATQFRGPGPAFAGLNGAGVIVGNVDTGVDYDHEDFKNASGGTRFLKIWDQTDPIGPPAEAFGYGSEWTAADIDARTSRARDTNGHGSHTLGIAAGDGSQTAGASAPAFTYAGMAPMADLIAVDASTTTGFTSTALIDGIYYIFQQATAFGKPAVANVSIGGSFGPHDGSSIFELAVDAMTGPGRAVVFSAGNDRGDSRHAEVNATASGAIVTMSCVDPVHNSRLQINGWYHDTEVIDVTVITPGGNVIGPIALGAMNAPYPGTSTANGLVYVENGVATSSNGSRQIIFDFRTGATTFLSGTWTFRFTAVALGAALGEVDLWRNFKSTPSLGAAFNTGDNSTEELINALGTGFNSITVASWDTRQKWADCRYAWDAPPISAFGNEAPDHISSFSSMGPTRDGRQKPEVAAPGSPIGSVNSGDRFTSCPTDISPQLPGLRHVMNQGTSMAAPHVSGAIALLFQKYGPLEVPQVRDLLQTRAVVDGFTGAVWNKDFGYGKLSLGDLSDPLCTVTAPNGGELVFVGDHLALTWNASDPILGVTGVDLEISRTGVGGPYTTIATNLANSGSFDWQVLGPATDHAILKVTARDAADNAGVDLSDLEWAITDPTVATTLASFRAEPTAEGIRLVWRFTDPSQLSRVGVERAVAAQGPWTELDAEVTREGEASVAIDRTAESGRTYVYRLSATYVTGGVATFGSLSVTAGESIAEFALGVIAPNPTEGPTSVEYAVPRACEVSVALFDLQGREVAELAGGRHPVGRFQVTWSGEVDGGPAPAGIYFLRLLAPGVALTRRIAVSR